MLHTALNSNIHNFMRGPQSLMGYYVPAADMVAADVAVLEMDFPTMRDGSSAGFRMDMGSWLRSNVGSIPLSAASCMLRIKHMPCCVNHSIGQVSTLSSARRRGSHRECPN